MTKGANEFQGAMCFITGTAAKSVFVWRNHPPAGAGAAMLKKTERKNPIEKLQRKKSMTYKIHSVALALFVALLSAFNIQAEDDLQAESKTALADFKKKDPTLSTFMDKCVGFAIFPDIGKGGFIVGGARGKGLVYEKGGGVIGKATMTQASIGAQAGGQSFAEIIFFETPAALNDFKEGKFEMSGEISAVAIKEGASAAAQYKNGIAVFTMPKKGAMVQASIGGQKFKYEPMSVGAPPKSESEKTEKSEKDK